MGLTEQEKATLEALSKKAKEPDAPPMGRNVSVSIDMGDAAQVARAQKWGFLPPDEEEKPPEGGDGGDGGEEDPPKRGGFFGNGS